MKVTAKANPNFSIFDIIRRLIKDLENLTGATLLSHTMPEQSVSTGTAYIVPFVISGIPTNVTRYPFIHLDLSVRSGNTQYQTYGNFIKVSDPVLNSNIYTPTGFIYTVGTDKFSRGQLEVTLLKSGSKYSVDGLQLKITPTIFVRRDA